MWYGISELEEVRMGKHHSPHRLENSHLRIPADLMFEATLIAAANPDVAPTRSDLLRTWLEWGRCQWTDGRRP